MTTVSLTLNGKSCSSSDGSEFQRCFHDVFLLEYMIYEKLDYGWPSDSWQPSWLLIKLMKGRRRNADEEQAACQTPFQFIEFSCDQLAHSSSSFLCQTKSSRPIRDESHSFVFPPNFIYLSPSIPYKVLTNPWLCIGSSRKTYCPFSLTCSEMHFIILSVSALTLRTRLTVFRLTTLFFIALIDEHKVA